MARRGFFARQCEVHQRIKAGEKWVLLQGNDLYPRTDRACAFVRLDLPGDDFEQRGFARAVASDQRQPVALTNVDVKVFEEPARAVVEAQALPA